MTDMIVTTGEVSFSNLTEHEVYNGKSTGKYSITLALGEDDAKKMEDMGVKLREYKGIKQRKFSSKFDVSVIDIAGDPASKHIPYGSKVRVLWKAGDAGPEHGVPCYLNKVRVLELAEGGDGEEPDEF